MRLAHEGSHVGHEAGEGDAVQPACLLDERGRRVAADYWGEGPSTLEWTQSSPPPFHTYETLPRIR